MADIPTYALWKKDTDLGAFHSRSKPLKNVDKALEQYWKTQSADDKKKLRTAFNTWLDGKDGRVTSRDKKGAVTEMEEALRPYRQSPQAWQAPPLPSDPAAGSVHLSQSFEYAHSLARAQVPQAFDRAKKLIDVAYRKIVMARSGGPDRLIYETWFGAYDQSRFATVFNNVKAIYDALHLKPVVLYYRGNGVTGPTDCAAEGGNLTPEDFFGAAWTPKNLPVSLDPKFTYIFLGKAFFTSGVFDQDSVGGVIIHELTHAICGTDDVVYKGEQTYGPALCQRLATERPQLAIHNADSYEYLCENYQNKLYQPNTLAIALPAKASINLAMRAPV